MIAIAGGILLAILVIFLLPVLIPLFAGLVGIVIVLALIGGVLLFVYSVNDPETANIIVGIILVCGLIAFFGSNVNSPEKATSRNHKNSKSIPGFGPTSTVKYNSTPINQDMNNQRKSWGLDRFGSQSNKFNYILERLIPAFTDAALIAKEKRIGVLLEIGKKFNEDMEAQVKLGEEILLEKERERVEKEAQFRIASERFAKKKKLSKLNELKKLISSNLSAFISENIVGVELNERGIEVYAVGQEKLAPKKLVGITVVTRAVREDFAEYFIHGSEGNQELQPGINNIYTDKDIVKFSRKCVIRYIKNGHIID